MIETKTTAPETWRLDWYAEVCEREIKSRCTGGHNYGRFVALHFGESITVREPEIILLKLAARRLCWRNVDGIGKIVIDFGYKNG